jgi:multiple sugar transport system ATP-binding protein
MDLQVAALLGQPKINLIPATIQKSGNNKWLILSDDNVIQIPVHLTKDWQNNEIIVGIRPQFIKLSHDVNDSGIAGEVYVSENLGIRNMVEIKIGKHMIRILSERNDYKIGQPVRVQIQDDKIILFDAHNGKNLFNYGKN